MSLLQFFLIGLTMQTLWQNPLTHPFVILIFVSFSFSFSFTKHINRHISGLLFSLGNARAYFNASFSLFKAICIPHLYFAHLSLSLSSLKLCFLFSRHSTRCQEMTPLPNLRRKQLQSTKRILFNFSLRAFFPGRFLFIHSLRSSRTQEHTDWVTFEPEVERESHLLNLRQARSPPKTPGEKKEEIERRKVNQSTSKCHSESCKSQNVSSLDQWSGLFDKWLINLVSKLFKRSERTQVNTHKCTLNCHCLIRALPLTHQLAKSSVNLQKSI